MNELAKPMLTTCMFSLRPPRNSSFLTNSSNVPLPLPLALEDETAGIEVYELGDVFVPLRLDVSSTPIRRTADRSIAARDLLTQCNGGRCTKYAELSPSLSLTPHATGMLALHEHHICLKNSVNPLLGRAHGTSIILYLPLDIIMRGTR